MTLFELIACCALSVLTSYLIGRLHGYDEGYKTAKGYYGMLKMPKPMHNACIKLYPIKEDKEATKCHK
jgi:hypothetical protein